MNAIRLLSAAVAYSVVLLEVYSGVIKGPVWWIVPGGLVIALLFAISLNVEGARAGAAGAAGPFQWILILALSFGMSAFAWYFGSTIVPDLLAHPPFAPAP